jgi:type VI secretion system secreted protein VgrG
VNGYDPDQPIIVGRVHNAVVQTPLRLPAEKTVSLWRSKSSPNSQGFNEIRMDDRAGAERLAIHAQRDYRSETGHDSTTIVVNDHALRVGQNHAANVGNNASTNVAGDHSVNVGKNEDVHVAGNRTTNVDGDDKVTIQGTQRTGVGGDHSFDAKAIKIHGKTIDLTGDDSIAITAPMISIFNEDSMILVMPGEVTIRSPHIQLEAGGSSISVTSSEIVETAGIIKLNP